MQVLKELVLILQFIWVVIRNLHIIFFYVFNKNWNSHSKSNVLMEWHEIQNIFSMLWTIHFLTLHKNYCTWNVVQNSSLTLLTLFLNFWEFENFICFYLLCYFNPETVGRQFSPSSSWFNPEHCLPHTYLKDLNQTSIPSFQVILKRCLNSSPPSLYSKSTHWT